LQACPVVFSISEARVMSAKDVLWEIKRQLKEQGGSGKVWIENWKHNFLHLAPSPRDFIEKHSDQFTLKSDGGNRYSVALKSKGSGKSSGKGTKGQAAISVPGGKWVFQTNAGSLPSQDQCIKEIEKQLARSGDGKVWVDNWKQRYGHLAASPREFMESCPSIFKLSYSGNAYTVSLAGKKGKSKGKGAAMAALPASSGPGDAIREIKQALSKSGDGKVWINQWKQRYGSLAESPKEFMENHPDIFTLTYEGKGFTVSLTGKTAAGKKRSSPNGDAGRPAKKQKKEEPEGEGTMEDVVEELKKQLQDPKNKEGKFWIRGWNHRFGHLNMTPKEVIQAYSDVFEIVEGDGNKFTVNLIEP